MVVHSAGLILEKVEIVLMQQISGPTAPVPAPAPAAQAPLIDKIIGLPVTPPVPPSVTPTAAPIQQSAASTGPSQNNRNTIIIAVVCVVGAAGEHGELYIFVEGLSAWQTSMSPQTRRILQHASWTCPLL